MAIIDFKVVEHEVSGEVHVDEHTQFNCMRARKLVIEEKTTVRLFGNVKELIIKRGAVLLLHGIIYGRIRNEGGKVHLFR